MGHIINNGDRRERPYKRRRRRSRQGILSAVVVALMGEEQDNDRYWILYCQLCSNYSREGGREEKNGRLLSVAAAFLLLFLFVFVRVM